MKRFQIGNADVFAIVLVIAIVIIVSCGKMIYRGITFDTATITPTSYLMSKSDGSTTREVFALEGEYRMSDTWLIPHNRSTGTNGNQIVQAVKLNNASLIREEAYTRTCDVKTWGIRLNFLSWYPNIYEVVSCGSTTILPD